MHFGDGRNMIVVVDPLLNVFKILKSKVMRPTPSSVLGVHFFLTSFPGRYILDKKSTES